ncbi:uncharacterized protein PHALS_09213 [Plasmopara halstedii]|uniref:Uncharacterized protein n=1 Tax=Plasmopara halstedii TaxID=4781 RepID=A0A0P1AF12_PLAHL|nr:uncharacterized protein PHALS_09213 [Plasmopara halstedii]CEG39158.1 hypothetical protein PHALS_09213 [Plasmopara halstedii]|eukprot:XP_024575527.1 hypothetical protein PHALS_09213 [Plasmopara halstedii]
MHVLICRLRAPVHVRRPSRLHLCLSSSLQSFSSSVKSKPSVLDGRDGVVQFANRAMERVSTHMERYREHRVFAPSNWMLHNYLLFTKLQLPTNTEIDAVEFLNGAQFACDLVVNTMYSSEFVNFATGTITESPAAEKLKLGLSENCYDAFLFAIKQTNNKGHRFKLNKLDINGIYLDDVNWVRISLARLKQEQALEAYNRAHVAQLEKQEESGSLKSQDKVVEKPIVDIKSEDHAVMIERLQLDVQLDAVEHLEVVTPEATDQTIEKKSSVVWRFESLVTQPEDLDWRIVSVI